MHGTVVEVPDVRVIEIRNAGPTVAPPWVRHSLCYLKSNISLVCIQHEFLWLVHSVKIF